MLVEQDPLNTYNGITQQTFNNKLKKVVRFCSVRDPKYHIQDDFVNYCKNVLNNNKTSYESKQKNSAYFASEFREAFRKNFSKKALVNVFEQVSIWLDLSDDDKMETFNVLKGYHIKCSSKCLNSFIPKEDARQKELNETGFYTVDRTPNYINTLAYSKRVLSNPIVSEETQKRILYFLDKHRAVYKKQIVNLGLFGRNVVESVSNHKKLVFGVLDEYKDKLFINDDFLSKLVAQTNFSDQEALSLEASLPEKVDIIRSTVAQRKNSDIHRLNNYIVNKKSEKEDDFSVLAHRCVYVSMLYSSLVEGNDINDIDLNKAYQMQLKRLNDMRADRCGGHKRDLFACDAWDKSVKEIKKEVLELDKVKIDAVLTKLDKSNYIDNSNYESSVLYENLKSLRGCGQKLSYSIYGALRSYE